MTESSFSRRLGLAVFRLHVENGIAVAVGMVAVGGAFLYAFGLPTTVLAYTGALCASIVDQPARLSIKPPLFAAAVLSTSVISFLGSLCQGKAVALGILVVAVSFATALVSAYGRRALGLGVTAILALVLGISGQTQNWNTALEHAIGFAEGGTAYAIFALLTALVLDGRYRRVALGEAMRAFANYLRARAALFDPTETARSALRDVIEAHSVLTENLQNARDMVFAGRFTPRRGQIMGALIALTDCFEMILSCDADIDILRGSSHRHLLRRMRTLTTDFATDTEALVIALTSPNANVAPPDHAERLHTIATEISRLSKTPPADMAEEAARAAFQATYNKLARAAVQFGKLYALIHDRKAAQPITSATLDLAHFMQQETLGAHILWAQFTIHSPTMRYAIRMTLAMVAGYLLTVFFPAYVHGGWVLLTIALIMRANYSTTRQRRNDRVVGTLLGCIVAALLIRYLPNEWPLLGVVAAVGVSHAFGTVNYRITALGASVSALLLLHYMNTAHGLFFDRILDTLVGAVIASLFSFLLPNWERRNVPQLVSNLLKADRAYAAQALCRAPVEQQYRLSRRAALDAVAALSGTARRLLDEPRADKRLLVTLNELLSANYLLASDLASVQTALRARSAETDAAEAEDILGAASSIVLEALSSQNPRGGRPTTRPRRALSDMPPGALPFLRRRLIHIERSARIVAALSARTAQG